LNDDNINNKYFYLKLLAAVEFIGVLIGYRPNRLSPYCDSKLQLANVSLSFAALFNTTTAGLEEASVCITDCKQYRDQFHRLLPGSAAAFLVEARHLAAHALLVEYE